MSHNISTVNGKESFVSAVEPAWHGLGVVLPKRFTSEEAIKYAALDYEVGLKPAVIELNGELVNVPKTFATYRKDTGDVFGSVGNKYTILQNREAFDFFDNIVGDKKAIFETAGSLGIGETIFITAKLPDYIKVKTDAIEKYLLLSTSHDGSRSTIAMFTPIRVVCSNTLAMALESGSGGVLFKHTKSIHKNLQKAEEIMYIAHLLSTTLQEVLEQAISVTIEDEDITNMIAYALGVKKDEEGKFSSRSLNMIYKAFSFYQNGQGQNDLCKGTLYGFYQGISGYLQHSRNYSSAEKKMKGIYFGTEHKIIQTAYTMMKTILEQGEDFIKAYKPKEK